MDRVRQAMRSGEWLTRERIRTALWLVPLVARTFPQVTLIPLGVPVMLAMLVLLLRRAGLALALPMAFSAAAIKQFNRE